MFFVLVWCLFFGATMCLGARDDSFDVKQNGQKVPQFMTDLYNKQVNESEFENEGKLSASKRSKYTYCERKTMHVEFDKVGQNHIIRPSGYNAYYCHGECPDILGSEMNPTTHAILQNKWHVTTGKVEAPCCVPTKLSSIQVLLHDDNGKIRKKQMENMVVEECGCR